MKIPPGKLDSAKPDTSYYPYLNSLTNTLNIENGRVLKGQFYQRNQTEGSDVFFKSVEFLNSVKFRINNTMLNWVLEEWGKDDPILFKGFNKFQPINPEDKSTEKIAKQVYNAKFHLYLNTINIAVLYRNEDLYFPVFGERKIIHAF